MVLKYMPRDCLLVGESGGTVNYTVEKSAKTLIG